MKARHKDTGEIIQLAEEGIISSDGRHFCWYQLDLIPEERDNFVITNDPNERFGIIQEIFGHLDSIITNSERMTSGELIPYLKLGVFLLKIDKKDSL